MTMPPKYTYEEYKLLKNDFELIDGYLYLMAPSPFGKHQKIMANLLFEFKKELEECECDIYPELDWIIDNENVLRPDLAIYCEEVEKYPIKPPKIVIEIVSSSTANRDEKIKFEIYEKEKVDFYVLVYPDFEKVRIFKNKDGKFDKIFEGNDEFKFDLCEMEINFKGVFK